MFPEFPHYSSTLRSYFSLLTSETTVEFCWMTWQPLRRLVDSRKIAYLQICIYFIYNIYIYMYMYHIHVVFVIPSDPSFARIFSDVLPNGNRVFMCISYTGRAVSCIWRRGLFLLTFCALNDTLHDIHTSGMSNASVHTLHMSKPVM